MRLLLILLLLISPAYATNVTQLITPSYSTDGGTQVRASQSANDLDCWTFPAWFGVSGATKLTVRVTTAAGTNFGVAIYSCSGGCLTGGDSGSAIFSGSTTTSAGYRTITVSSNSLSAGTVYRWCFCADNAGALLAGHSNTTNASTIDQILNKSTTRAGKGGSCTSGSPPATSGSLSTIGTPSLWGFPFVAVE